MFARGGNIGGPKCPLEKILLGLGHLIFSLIDSLQKNTPKSFSYKGIIVRMLASKESREGQASPWVKYRVSETPLRLKKKKKKKILG